MIAAIVLAVAISQAPIPKPDGYARVGMATWGRRMAMANANAEYLPSVTGTSTACFAYRVPIVLAASGGEVQCVFSQEANVTFDHTVDTALSCDITDTGLVSGTAACVMLADRERVKVVPWPMVYPQPGQKTGVCSATTIAPGGATVYVPCDDNNDCVSNVAAGATCNTTMSGADVRHMREQGCVFLVCQADTAGAYLYVGVEQ